MIIAEPSPVVSSPLRNTSWQSLIDDDDLIPVEAFTRPFPPLTGVQLKAWPRHLVTSYLNAEAINRTVREKLLSAHYSSRFTRRNRYNHEDLLNRARFGLDYVPSYAWHTVSCVCIECLDRDVKYIADGGGVLNRKTKLFLDSVDSAPLPGYDQYYTRKSA